MKTGTPLSHYFIRLPRPKLPTSTKPNTGDSQERCILCQPHDLVTEAGGGRVDVGRGSCGATAQACPERRRRGCPPSEARLAELRPLQFSATSSPLSSSKVHVRPLQRPLVPPPETRYPYLRSRACLTPTPTWPTKSTAASFSRKSKVASTSTLFLPPPSSRSRP